MSNMIRKFARDNYRAQYGSQMGTAWRKHREIERIRRKNAALADLETRVGKARGAIKRDIKARIGRLRRVLGLDKDTA